MTTSTPSTAYSRDLGDELRRLRESCADLKGAAFAIRLGWDPSKVSTIEKGKARPSEIDLVQYLTICGKDCVLWEYEKAMPVAFTSTDLAKVFVQDPGAIARTRLLFDRLAEVSLDEEQSRRMLAEYVGRLR